MEHIFEHYKKTGYLHHAHMIEGGADEVVPFLENLLRIHVGVAFRGNPDVSVEHYESFGIDDARNVSVRQTRNSFEKSNPSQGFSGKIFILTIKSFTREAQNALLKTFEEPTLGTHFFIVIPHSDAILPTLKSRMVFVKFGTHHTQDNLSEVAVKFLDASLEEKFIIIKKLTEVKKGEVVDREKIRMILDHLERILYTRTAGTNSKNIFKVIYDTKKYLADRGSSPKMLLEHVAVSLSLQD